MSKGRILAESQLLFGRILEKKKMRKFLSEMESSNVWHSEDSIVT